MLPVLACGPGPAYDPNGLRIFRVVDDESIDPFTQNMRKNVDAWCNLVGASFSFADVKAVVYKSGVDDVRYMREKHRLPSSLNSNAFAKALCDRSDLLDFLITAKTCETARGEMNDPWYYPSHHCPHVAALEGVIQAAEGHTTDTLLHDRYALQQMRAQLSLNRHQENVNLWETYASHLPQDNVLRTLMVDYAVGAYQNVGDASAAKDLIMDESGYFDNLRILARIQSDLRNTDYEGIEPYDWEAERMRVTFLQNRKTAIEAIQHPATQRKAEWYYTLAYIDDALGNDVSSEQYLRKAEKAGGDDFIRESVHLFRIYRDAKSLPVNDAYEQQMLTNLRWIEERLLRDFPKGKELEKFEPWRVVYNYSTYYWNDMLRRIGLGIYAKRLAGAGRTLRSIEVINYAENRIFKELKSDFMDDNHFGYLFQALDTRSAANTLQYVDRLQHPKDELSRFLLSGSYVDYDWLHNIAGTLYIRESQFGKAVDALSHLSQSYTGDSICDDPFIVDYRSPARALTHTTRRAFAAEMVRLEKVMKSASNVNDRADAQLKYAIALRNIHTTVWQAVAYGNGYAWYIDSYTPNTHKLYTETALERSDKMLEQAMLMYTDDERAASAELSLKNFRTVMEHYPNTAAAEFVRSHCENYYDFGLRSFRSAPHLTSWYFNKPR